MDRTSMFDRAKLTVMLRVYGMLKIPMVLFISPSIMEANEQRAIVKIPLIRRNKNHLNSMYFGVLASGADLVAGFLTMSAIRRSKENVSMVFKSFTADFGKRIEGDAFFECSQGAEISECIRKAVATGERVEIPLTVTVTVPSKLKEPAASFTLVLSVKKKS